MTIYRITYPEFGVTQYKCLISHSDYVEAKNISAEASKERMQELTSGMEYFTDKSPLHDAIATGILNCHIITECIVEPTDLTKEEAEVERSKIEANRITHKK